jgi:ABC-type transport system involved in multi-copper enzyme maturation permease subunit
VMIVVATMFITAEYRRGLIRTTFTATPSRGRVLAAKAVVIGAVAFVTGAVAAAVAIPLGEHLLETNGNYVFPVSTLTELRIVAGAAAVVAVTAVAVLALGAILRRSGGAVTAGIVVFVLPYVLGSAISDGGARWVFRLSPAAGFAVLGSLPYSAQVSYRYTFANGYYPLAPWGGLLVLCAYAALALGVAAFLLRRRDA